MLADPGSTPKLIVRRRKNTVRSPSRQTRTGPGRHNAVTHWSARTAVRSLPPRQPVERRLRLPSRYVRPGSVRPGGLWNGRGTISEDGGRRSTAEDGRVVFARRHHPWRLQADVIRSACTSRRTGAAGESTMYVLLRFRATKETTLNKMFRDCSCKTSRTSARGTAYDDVL